MCGRYELHDIDKIASRFDVGNWDDSFKPNYNVAPTQTMPVIILKDNKRYAQKMRWGIERFIGGDKPVMMFNTKSEKAFQRFWGKTVRTQRLLVPANGFYEWKQSKTTNEKSRKQPYYIKPKGEDLFALAGVYNISEDKDGKESYSFSILTTTPNKEMTTVHNRMPVILTKDEESEWLKNTDDDSILEHLMKSYRDNGLELIEVSTDVNKTSNNYKELFYPLNSQ